MPTSPRPRSTANDRHDEQRLGDILSQALHTASSAGQMLPHVQGLDDADVVEIHYRATSRRGEDPQYLVHQTELLRRPVYRPERADNDADQTEGHVIGHTADGQSVFAYQHSEDTELQSTLGELNARDMLVMSVLQQAFWAAGCPADNMIRGRQATLYYISRQVGINDSATHLIKASVARLFHSKVVLRFKDARRARDGGYQVNEEGEVGFGFISGYGWRQRSAKGRKETETSQYIMLDQTLAQLIRQNQFTLLRADILRTLRHQPVALKLYCWARTHEPNESGFLMRHHVSTLADKLAIADTNITRRRRKIFAALEAVHAAAPQEFPGYELEPRTARAADPIIHIRRRKPALAQREAARLGGRVA